MKRFLIAAALVLAPAIVSAQTATQAINTTVTVSSAVSFASPSDLDFGSAIPGAAAGVTEKGVTTTGGTVGSVVLYANQAVNVSAAYTSLTGPGTALSATPACGYNSSSTASSATTFTCATGFTSPATGTGSAGYYVFLGGSVTLPAGQQAGVYSGTATVTGTYTNY